MDSLERTAWLAGLLYRVSSLPAPFALIYVPNKRCVEGNTAATTERLRTFESPLRMGIVTELFGMSVFLPWIPALLLIAGYGYVALCTAQLGFPQYVKAVDRVTSVTSFAEMPIILWLLIWGARPQQAMSKPQSGPGSGVARGITWLTILLSTVTRSPSSGRPNAREESFPLLGSYFFQMRKSLVPVVVLFLCAASALAAEPSARPAEWAISVAGTTVQNLYRIEDNFYRGAQPSAAGFQELAGLGVKTVLDLAGGGGDDPFARGGSLKLVHVPMTAFGLRDDRVLEALRVMADPANRPLMIHCKHGSDRTGALVALYRVVVQGWTREKAVEEMNKGGYHHSSLWRNLDRYVMRADVDALRKNLKLEAPNPTAPDPIVTGSPAALIASPATH